ncbi:MAG: hypothetical protein Q8O30_00720 [Candidatus Omnitrophota bacterium]|nr:hypothetical protein [Candidatus Omnitrophota bacterium]
MKIKLLLIIVLFLFCLGAQADNKPSDIPQVLKNLGFTVDDLASYYRSGDTEFFRFPDTTTIERDDVIVYIVKDKEIKDIYKENQSE